MADVNGFLLGAGASFELGMPLVDELSVNFKTALLRTIDKPYYKCPVEIRKVVESLLSDADLSYEEILGRIEIEIQRNHAPDLHNEWHWLLGRYIEAIYFLLLECHQRNIEYVKERLDLFKPLKLYSKDQPLWVFSLNHDVLFEIICNYLKIPIKFGFHDETQIRGLTFQRLTSENMAANQFAFFQNSNGVNLVKLHGALDLFVQGNKKDYLKLTNSASPFDILSDIASLIKNDAARKDFGVRVANEVTYNDESGELQFLRMSIMSGKHKYSKRLQHNLDEWFLKIFQGHINHVTHLYAIGYSFGDPHINNAVYDWLAFAPSRKLTIVDPNIGKVPASFRHLKDQIYIKRLGFLRFLNQDARKFILLKISLFEKARSLSRRIFTRRK